MVQGCLCATTTFVQSPPLITRARAAIEPHMHHTPHIDLVVVVVGRGKRTCPATGDA